MTRSNEPDDTEPEDIASDVAGPDAKADEPDAKADEPDAKADEPDAKADDDENDAKADEPDAKADEPDAEADDDENDADDDDEADSDDDDDENDADDGDDENDADDDDDAYDVRSNATPTPSANTSTSTWWLVLVVTLATSAAVFQAFRPDNAGQMSMLLSLGAVYAVFTVITVLWMRHRGEQKSKLTPHRGDVTFGAIIAVGMYLLATGVHILLTSRGSPKEAWLIRVYLQIGDPELNARFFVGPIIFAVAAMEELVWRGLVLGALRDRLSNNVALLSCTALYGLSHASTLYLLRDPYIGLNPLVMMAALGCGLIWGWIALMLDRLALSMIAHALFIWAVVEFPIMNM